MKKIIYLLFVMLLATACSNDKPDEISAEGEPLYSIRLNLKKGENYSRTTLINQENRQNIQGKTIEMNQNVSTKMDFAVIETDESGFTLELKYSDIHFELVNDLPGMNNGQNEIMETMNKTFSEAVKLMKKSSIRFHITPDGTIANIKGAKDFQTIMQLYLKGHAYHKEVISHFSTEQIHQSLSSFFSYLPKKSVEINEVWVSEMSVDQLPGVSLKQYHKLKKSEKSKLLISTERNQMGEDIQKLDTTINGILFTGETKGKGELIISRKTGFILSGKTDLQLSGRVQGDPDQIEQNALNDEVILNIKVKTIIK